MDIPFPIGMITALEALGSRLAEIAGEHRDEQLDESEQTVLEAVKESLQKLLGEVVVLEDGAHWIWSLASDYFGQRTEIADFYHATEHLWVLAKALYDGGTANATHWADKQIRILLMKGSRPLLKTLKGKQAPTSETTQALLTETNYFQPNAHRMDYPTFKKRALPIASGAIESAAIHFVQQRFKRLGARWSQEGVAAVLAVRSCLLSGIPIVA